MRARRERADAMPPLRPPAGPPDLAARELLAALDAELARLPDRFRLPLVLCCLEGLTQDEAAARLGWTPDSVRGQLQRGRRRLHAGLARRGLAFSAGAGAALLLLPTAVDAGPLRAAATAFARGGPIRPAGHGVGRRGRRAGVWVDRRPGGGRVRRRRVRPRAEGAGCLLAAPAADPAGRGSRRPAGRRRRGPTGGRPAPGRERGLRPEPRRQGDCDRDAGGRRRPVRRGHRQAARPPATH